MTFMSFWFMRYYLEMVFLFFCIMAKRWGIKRNEYSLKISFTKIHFLKDYTKINTILHFKTSVTTTANDICQCCQTTILKIYSLKGWQTVVFVYLRVCSLGIHLATPKCQEVQNSANRYDILQVGATFGQISRWTFPSAIRRRNLLSLLSQECEWLHSASLAKQMYLHGVTLLASALTTRIAEVVAVAIDTRIRKCILV